MARDYGTWALQAPYNYHKFIEMNCFLTSSNTDYTIVLQLRLFQSKNVVSFITIKQTLLEWTLFTMKPRNMHGTLGILKLLNYSCKALTCKSSKDWESLGIHLSIFLSDTGFYSFFFKRFYTI